MLYRGARLAQAREWASTHTDEMNEREHEFLDASLAQVQSETAEREAQRQRELKLRRNLLKPKSNTLGNRNIPLDNCANAPSILQELWYLR